jgi:hypothetical protein
MIFELHGAFTAYGHLHAVTPTYDAPNSDAARLVLRVHCASPKP